MAFERVPPFPEFTNPPQRVVSLVPSLTESLFDLGLGETLVGITDYCIHPASAVASLPRVGGPKNPDLDAILALAPDLVLANREENTRAMIDALNMASVSVWVTFPQTVVDALQVLRGIVELFRDRMAHQRLESLVRAWEFVRLTAAEQEPLRYFCPIWFAETTDGQSWWMTFNRHTYMHDLLSHFGGVNIFADRKRKYPLAADLGAAPAESAGERDSRYPRVTLDEIIAADPQLVLLPSEPFAFDQTHRKRLFELLDGTAAAQNGRLDLLDGSLITWHGTRLARAMQQIRPLFNH